MPKGLEFKGNKKIEARLKKLASVRQVVKGYDVGFFKQSVYPDGTLVTSVAFWNEFGTKFVPERPFFRTGNKKAEKPLIKLIDKLLNENDSYVLSKESVSLLGQLHASQIQKSIVDLRDPPNAVSTIDAKGGKSNPLIDTGEMRRSVISKVVE
ncbi:MAG: hypothetical protein V3V61_01315 [Gammaproteobacteria bacterium]